VNTRPPPRPRGAGTGLTSRHGAHPDQRGEQRADDRAEVSMVRSNS
jgi:hypothetical protein